MAPMIHFASCCLVFATIRAKRLEEDDSLEGPLDSVKWAKVYVNRIEQCLEQLSPTDNGYRFCQEARDMALNLKKVAADSKNYAETPQWKSTLEDAQTKMKNGFDDPMYKPRNGYNRHDMVVAGKQLLAESFELNLDVSKPKLFDAVQSFIVSAEGAGVQVSGLADATLVNITAARQRANFLSGKRWAYNLYTGMKKVFEGADKSGNNWNKLRDKLTIIIEFYNNVALQSKMYTGKVLDQDTIEEGIRMTKVEVQQYAPGFSEFESKIKANAANLVRGAAAHGLDVKNTDVISGLCSMASWGSSADTETQMGQVQATFGTYNSF